MWPHQLIRLLAAVLIIGSLELVALVVNAVVLPAQSTLPVLYALGVLVAAYRFPLWGIGLTGSLATILYGVAVVADESSPVARPFGVATVLAFTWLALVFARQRQELVRRQQETDQARGRTEVGAAEIERVNQTLRAVIETMPAGVAVTDARGAFVQENPAVAAILRGPLTGDAYGPQGSYTLHRSDGSSFLPEELPLACALDHGETVRDVEILLRRQDGTEVAVLVTAAPIRDGAGQVTGAVAVFQDVTERKRAEEQQAALAIDNARLYRQAEEAVRQRDELLSSVSHDLKNHLSTLKGHVQLLRRRAMQSEAPEAQPLVEGLRNVEPIATKMAAMLDELVDVAHLQIGQQLSLDRQPTDLVVLTQQTVAEYQRTTGRHRIVADVAVPQLVGLWDAARLERVLGNLLANAIKYSPAGGEVTVRVARDDETAFLQVEDRGIGIPAGDRPHIFERFHRGRNVGRRFAGTGIGLAGARQIVEQHGGTISVESEEGAGSTFTVRLPLMVPPIDTPATWPHGGALSLNVEPPPTSPPAH